MDVLLSLNEKELAIEIDKRINRLLRILVPDKFLIEECD